MKRLFLIFLSFSLLLSCEKTWQPEHVDNLVVEGWIESGGYPVVMVTTSVPTDTSFQAVDSLDSHVIRWAKVTVSDGETSVVLTGQRNKRYFPPYIYSSTRIIGVPGRTYSLTVEYKSYRATAHTTIPEPRRLDAVQSEPLEGSDGLYNLVACFTDPPETGDYYKFFVRVQGSDSTYVPTFLGTIDDAVLDGYTEVRLHRSRTLRNMDTFQPFVKGERVSVRFCTMDEQSFIFWKSYEEVSSMSSSPVFQATYNLPSNMEGALGYWAGYGISDCLVTVGEDVKVE